MPDVLRGGIAINEILPDPNGPNNFDTDGNGVATGSDEFVELTNTSIAAIDISGLEMWDAGRDNWFTFPPGTFLQAGASAVIIRNVQPGGSLPVVTGDNLAFNANFGSNIFNNGRDNIVVYDPAADTFIQATYNDDALDDPTATPPNTYEGFSETATRIGDGENFGSDQDGFSIQRTGTGFFNDQTPTPGAENICFAAGTCIATPSGFVPIEALKVGDQVLTQRSGPQTIRWIYGRTVGIAEQLANPNLRPIALGGGSGLRISRQHRLLITGKIALRMFSEDEILVPAKDLVGHAGFSIPDQIAPLRYFHLLLDRHHILNANGIAAESLFLGSESRAFLSADALNDLAAASIEKNLSQSAIRLPCRPQFSGHKVRSLARRHAKNAHALATGF